jgi:hypothetical protein
LSNKVHFAKSYEDSILWIKLDKEIFDFSEDVLLCLCYNIPAGSSRQLFVNENIFDKIVEDILFFNDKYTNCNFVITGDLNARIGLKPDYVENEYLCNLDFMPDDYVEDGILPRNSQDKTINDEGKLLLNFCKLTGLRVCNGRVLDDKQGKYTCVKSAGSSVVDYVLCKPELFSFFSKFQVLDPNIWSDHCMINFTLGTIGCHQKEISETSKSYEQLEYVYKWDKDKQITYENVLNSETYFNDFQHLIGSLSNMQDKTQIDENLQTFYLVIDEVCSPLFRKNVKSNKVAKPITKISQPWYDHACKEKQKHFYDNLNIFRNEQSDSSRINMVSSRSDYKEFIRQRKRSYDALQLNKLENLKLKNAKEYWKMLKGLCTPSQRTKLTTDEFEQYFKAINDSNSRFFQADEDIIDFNERYINNELQCMFQELNIDITYEEMHVNSLILGDRQGRI